MTKLPADTPAPFTRKELEEFIRKKKAGTLPPRPKLPVRPDPPNKR